MQNDPQYGAPPPAGGSLKEPRGAAPGLRLAAGLLLGALALYLFLPAGLPPPREDARPAGQGAPGAPERTAPLAAGGVQAESLTPPRGVPPEENFAPPAAGLLVPLRPFDPGAARSRSVGVADISPGSQPGDCQFNPGTEHGPMVYGLGSLPFKQRDGVRISVGSQRAGAPVVLDGLISRA